jgi:hypothetical protein
VIFPPSLEQIRLQLVVNRDPPQAHVYEARARWVTPTVASRRIRQTGLLSPILSAPKRRAEQFAGDVMRTIADALSDSEAQDIARQVNAIANAGLRGTNPSPEVVANVFQEILAAFGLDSADQKPFSVSDATHWLQGFRELSLRRRDSGTHPFQWRLER